MVHILMLARFPILLNGFRLLLSFKYRYTVVLKGINKNNIH